jgi:hypothetical protein
MAGVTLTLGLRIFFFLGIIPAFLGEVEFFLHIVSPFT